MNRIHSHLDEVNFIGKLADLKESHCHHSLVLSAVIQVLIDKGIITAQELQKKSQELNLAFTEGPSNPIS